MNLINLFDIIYDGKYSNLECIKIDRFYNKTYCKINGSYSLESKTIDKHLSLNLKEFNYAIYYECGYTGDWIFNFFNDIKDLENYILSEQTFFNMCTSSLKVIEKNKMKDYRVIKRLDNKEIELYMGEELNTDFKNIKIIWK